MNGPISPPINLIMRVNSRHLALTTATLALLFLGAGCAKKSEVKAPPAQIPPSGAATNAAAPGAAPESVPTAAADQGVSPCDHPYYPLIPGYAISYVTKSGSSQVDYTMTVGEVNGTSAKVNYSFSKPVVATITQELGCKAGAILAKTYLDMSSVLGGADIKVETKSASGNIMPGELRIGTTWNNGFETTLTPGPTFPAKIGPMTANVNVYNRVIGEEEVKVPAGTFTALKVEVQSTQKLDIPNMPTQPPETMVGYQWWVKGVGLVKQTSGTGTANESVTEATSIKKP